MSYSNPMHHAPGKVSPRAYTLPDGRKAPDAPASWPFGLESVRKARAPAARAFLASRPAAPF